MREGPSVPVEHDASAGFHLARMAQNGTSIFLAVLQREKRLNEDESPSGLLS